MQRPAVFSLTVAIATLVLALMAVVLGGCGGSSSSAVAPTPEPAAEPPPFYFVADLTTGKVTALPAGEIPEDGVRPQVVGTNTGPGSPLVVSSSDMFDYAGNPGWRTIRLRVVNTMSMPVGESPTGEITGLDLVFTSLVFKKGDGLPVHGGAVLSPDKYDPNGQLPVIHYDTKLAGGGGAAERQVSFLVPMSTTQIVWSVVVRTDTTFPGSFPKPTVRCWVSTVAGSGVPGLADGAAHLAQFTDPRGLCVAPNGAIIVADFTNDALREITPSGYVRTIPLKGVVVNGPVDVAIDVLNSAGSTQILYVTALNSDRVFRIVRNSNTNNTSSVVPVVGGGADPDSTTTADTLALTSPTGIACDLTGGFWMTDYGTNDRVYYIRPQPGISVTTAAASQYQVLTNLPGLTNPCDCSVDDHGNVFIVEGGANRVTRRDADGSLTTIPLPSLGWGACTVNGPGTICYLKSPSTSRISHLRLIGANPKLAGSWMVSLITDGGSGYQDGSGLTAKFSFDDEGLDLDPSGTLYVTDRDNHRIRRLDRLAGE